MWQGIFTKDLYMSTVAPLLDEQLAHSVLSPRFNTQHKQSHVGKRKSSRSEFSLYASKPLPDREKGEESGQYQTRILYILLLRRALSIMGTYYRRDDEVTDEQLIDILSEYAPTACREHDLPSPVTSYEIASGGSVGHSITWENIEREAKHAVDLARELFDPEKVQRISKLASEYGKKGRTYSVFTYLLVRHLCVSEAARGLGGHRSQADRMFKRYRAYSDEQLQQIMRGELPDE